MDEHICIIVDNGWILEGKVLSRDNGTIRMEGAHVVRRWSNGRGIGALADPKHKSEYTLDPIGDVSVYVSRALFEFPLNW